MDEVDAEEEEELKKRLFVFNEFMDTVDRVEGPVARAGQCVCACAEKRERVCVGICIS
jgi:hypothetical protein